MNFIKKKTLKRSILFFAGAVLVFGGYFGYQLKNYLKGPKIIVENLKEWNVLGSSLLELKGIAKNISGFYLNGRKIFTSENGDFKEKLVLAPGLNIIELKAEDKFGHEFKQTYYVFYSKEKIN